MFHDVASGLRIILLSGALCVSAVAQDSAGQTTGVLNTSVATGEGQRQAVSLSQDEVERILSQAEERAKRTASGVGLRSSDDEKRAAKFHIFVVDRQGNILGRRSQDDAWTGSVDIALGKARTAAFFSSDENALSSRHLGELTQPDGDGAGPLWGIGHTNQAGGDGPSEIKKNTLVTFPGGLPLFKDGRLVGGIGVSGDGVDQDEAVAFGGAEGFMPDDEVGRPGALESPDVDEVE